jgi:hypothetical protein
VDVDLPLTYQFGFTSNSGIDKVVRSFTEQTYTVTVLPAGLESSGYSKTTILQVSDSLGELLSIAIYE